MKTLITWLALLLPFYATAQVNGTIQRTAATGITRYYNAVAAGIDTLASVQGIGVNGQTLIYNSTLKKYVPTTVLFGYPENSLTPSVLVTDSDDYSAFPSIVKLNDGKLFTVYRKASTHTSGDGIIAGKFSLDTGKTWQSEITVLSEPGWSLSPGGVKLLANGDILMSMQRSDGATFSTFTSRTILLNQSGVPITSPVLLGAFTGGYDTFGDIVQLSNGSILVAAYGVDGADTKVKVLRSTDNGVSWSTLSTIATHAGTSLVDSYNETSLFLLPNGNVVATVRHETGYIATSKSTDSGATWSTVTDRFTGLSAATMAMLGNKLVVNYRLVSPEVIGNQVGLRYSTDEGSTWSDPYSISALTSESFMYGGMVNISNKLGFIYSFEKPDTTANIYYKTVDVNSLGDPIMFNVNGLVNKGRLSQKGDVFFESGRDNKIGVNSNFTYANKLSLGAGLGASSAFGGEFASYGLAHATKPGWQSINLPTGTSSKFTVNNNGIGTGTDIFSVDRATGVVYSSSLTTGLVKSTSGILGNATSGTDYTLLNGTGVVEMAGTIPAYRSSTGTGDIVKATSPTLITPVLGIASGNRISLNSSTAAAYTISAINNNGFPTGYFENQLAGSFALYTVGSKNYFDGTIISGSMAGSGNVIAGTDNTGLFGKISVGSGLSLSAGVLSATGGASGFVTTPGMTAGRLVIANSASDIGTTTALTLSGSDLSSTGLFNAGTKYQLGSWDIASYSGSALRMGGVTGAQWTSVERYTGGTLRETLNSTGLTLVGTISASNFSGSSSGANTGDQNLAPYATLASPALTGTPTAPTPTAGDNSTKIATTAYVDGKFRSGSYSDTLGTTGGIVISFTALPSTSFQVLITPASSVVSSSNYYISSKSTNSFQIAFSPSISGAVAFDWMVIYNP